MPIPSPTKGESEKDFVSRCISAVSKADPERDPKQVAAICFNQYRRKEGLHEDFKRILGKFTAKFGELEGLFRFNGFIEANGLNPLISIFKDARANPNRLKESFSWIEPLIAYVKADSEAKYYKVRALTCNVSMNNNDYSDPEKLKNAAISMNYMPVNMNHNHAAWLSYPRTRMDWSKFEDMELEGLLRVDNQDVQLQKMLDHDPSIPESEWINHPSIEARHIPESMGGGYHFTALALLQKGVAIPGDPLTEIMPVFAESLGASVKKLVEENNQGKKESPMKEETKSVKEATAGYCAMCGMKLEGNMCPNKDCEAYGKQVEVSSEATRLNQKIADLTDELTQKTKNETALQTENGTLKTEKIDLAEKLAKATRENLKIGIADTQINVLKEKLEKTLSDLNTERGAKEAYAKEIGKLNEQINRHEAANTKLEERLGKTEIELETTRRDLNEESAKRASAEQKALNETKEASRIKLENANLLEEKARDTRSISDIAEKQSQIANKLLEQTNLIDQLKREKIQLTEAIEEIRKDSGKIKRANISMQETLRKNNIVEVDKDGNITL